MNRPGQTLTKPLLAFAGVLLAAVAAVHFTLRSVDKAEAQFNTQQAQLNEARARVQKSGAEKELIAQYLGSYQKLRQVGFVGEEQRINWLDALRVANQAGDLFGIDYQVSPQRPYPYASAFAPGQIAILESVMKLRFALLHEEDLMRFFELLAQQRAGVFLIDQCALQRTSSGTTLRFQPNLTADCELSWITAKPPAAQDAQK